MVFLGGKARIWMNGKLLGEIAVATVDVYPQEKLLEEEKNAFNSLAVTLSKLLNQISDISMITAEEDSYIRDVIERSLRKLHRLSTFHYEWDFKIDYENGIVELEPKRVAPPLGPYIKKTGYWT